MLMFFMSFYTHPLGLFIFIEVTYLTAKYVFSCL